MENVWKRAGASCMDFQGVQVPVSFGDVAAECHAAREGCALFPASFRSLVKATGEDRITFLQGMLSNDVKALAAGHGTRAAFLTQTAHVVADLRVYVRDDGILLDVFRSREQALIEGLGRYIVADDVELARDESLVPLFSVEGPRAGAVLSATGLNVLPADAYAHTMAAWREASLLVVRISEFGGNGFLLCGPSDCAVELLEALRKQGAQPAGMEALNVLRVEGGVPWYGVDMSEDHLLMETGLTGAISFTKGCYLGQEVVERVSARGHVNRKLAGLLVKGEAIPAAGSRLLADGKEAGYVTSAVRSHTLGRIIGLGYVHRNCLRAGNVLQVDSTGAMIEVTVTELPFVACQEKS